jgi:hypothetical protein
MKKLEKGEGVMIDMLFVEIGAVVTEVTGPSRCTIEAFCHPAKPPTYNVNDRIEVDLAFSIENVLTDPGLLVVTGNAPRWAMYDQGYGSAPIGPSWPGGGYEGVVSVRADVVKANATLAAAAAELPGQPWEYQVVTSIDEETGTVARRYHGFHAELVEAESGVLVLQVADAGKSADPSSPRWTVRYDPADTETFYAGELVAENLVRGDGSPRNSGAVFITLEAVESFGGSLPKLPPGAGL